MKTNLKAVLFPASETLATADPVFDLAPISLWMEDYSLVKQLLDTWKFANADALDAFLSADPYRVKACAELIKVVKVNQKTLDLYEAGSQAQLLQNLGSVFRDEMLDNLRVELVALWRGETGFSSQGVNYTLGGTRMDVLVKARLLPGHEADWSSVLVCVDNITALESSRREARLAQDYANGLFDHSPISLWVEDFSQVKLLFDGLRAAGIRDFKTFTDVNPDFVKRCASEVRILDVNQHSLKLYAAPDKSRLLAGLDVIFGNKANESFRELLIDLWDGKLFQHREVMNFALDGSEIYLHLQFSVLPGHEQDWACAQVALTDITARKKAEAYLEFLGKNDVLTKLHNRTFYTDEIARLERKGPFPVTAIVIDINGLKDINDNWGHAAGDTLLRRAGEVLQKAVEKPNIAARIGGDEFVVLMPGGDAKAGAAMIEDIHRLVELNNKFHKAHVLSFSLGTATAGPTDRLDNIVRLADERMYETKRKLGLARK